MYVLAYIFFKISASYGNRPKVIISITDFFENASLTEITFAVKASIDKSVYCRLASTSTGFFSSCSISLLDSLTNSGSFKFWRPKGIYNSLSFYSRSFCLLFDLKEAKSF